MKVAFIGLPSCGKTTTSKLIANFLNGIYIPEIARIYIESLDRPLQSGDQYRIAMMQSNLEKELSKNERTVICDIPVYASAIYDIVYNKGLDRDKILKLSDEHRYNKIFYLKHIPKYEEDGVRYQTPLELVKLKILIEQYNKKYNVITIKETDKKSRLERIVDEVL